MAAMISIMALLVLVMSLYCYFTTKMLIDYIIKEDKEKKNERD